MGKKKSDLGDTDERGEKEKQFGIQTSSHGQERQQAKSCLFFSRSCLFSPGMIRVFEGPEEFPCTNPYSPAGALSLKALARLGHAEYAQLKSISIVRAGCHTSHAVGYGTPNTACG